MGLPRTSFTAIHYANLYDTATAGADCAETLYGTACLRHLQESNTYLCRCNYDHAWDTTLIIPAQVWPEVSAVSVSSPPIPMLEYPNDELPLDTLVRLTHTHNITHMCVELTPCHTTHSDQHHGRGHTANTSLRAKGLPNSAADAPRVRAVPIPQRELKSQIQRSA